MATQREIEDLARQFVSLERRHNSLARARQLNYSTVTLADGSEGYVGEGLDAAWDSQVDVGDLQEITGDLSDLTTDEVGVSTEYPDWIGNIGFSADEAWDGVDFAFENAQLIEESIDETLEDMQEEFLDLANTKNTVWYQGTEPTGSNHRTGDTWFDTSNDNAIHRWDGSDWELVPLGDDAIDGINASKITAGHIDAARIGANTITANKLAVGDITNRFPDQDFQDPAGYAPFTVVDGQLQISLTDDSLQQHTFDSLVFPVLPGEEYGYRVRVTKSSPDTFAGMVFEFSEDGSSWVPGVFTENSFTVPEDIKFVRAGFSAVNELATDTVTYSDPVIRLKAVGELIVDGAITGTKLTADAIDGKAIRGVEIYGGRFYGGGFEGSEFLLPSLEDGVQHTVITDDCSTLDNFGVDEWFTETLDTEFFESAPSSVRSDMHLLLWHAAPPPTVDVGAPVTVTMRVATSGAGAGTVSVGASGLIGDETRSCGVAPNEFVEITIELAAWPNGIGLSTNLGGQVWLDDVRVRAYVSGATHASIYRDSEGRATFESQGVSRHVTIQDGRLTATDGGLTPVGTVMPYAGTTEPAGYLMCNGQALYVDDYPALYAVIGTRFGGGSGGTVFYLPDLAGRMPLGREPGYPRFGTLGDTGGEEAHTLTTAEMPPHNHGGVTGGSSVSMSAGAVVGTGSYPARGGGAATVLSGVTNTGHTHSITSQGGGGAHNNMPPYIVLNYIIKT